jgi:hypothetical protein
MQGLLSATLSIGGREGLNRVSCREEEQKEHKSETLSPVH